MRVRRVTVAVTILLSLLCVASGASVVGTPTPSATPTQDGAPMHTLVITSNGTGSYTVTAANKLQLKRGEQRDYHLGGPRISGTVGERGDVKDVIRFHGHIESFQADGSIRVTLDGRQIAPRVLGGQYMQISRSGRSSAPIRYQFGVTGQASRGALAEQSDTVSTQRIHGRVRDVDSFYFTGTIPNDSITISGPATVMINGQNASVFLSHAPPTPPSPRSSPSPTMTPVPPPTDGTTERRASTPIPVSPTMTPTPTSASAVPGWSFGWLETVAVGLVVVLALAGWGILLVLR